MLAHSGLDRAKDAVACIPETGKNVALFVEPAIECRVMNGHIRVIGIDGVEALGSSHQTGKMNVFSALFFELGDGGAG